MIAQIIQVGIWPTVIQSLNILSPHRLSSCGAAHFPAEARLHVAKRGCVRSMFGQRLLQWLKNIHDLHNIEL